MHSMAEHEAEMQRQSMTVPGSGPPPPQGVPNFGPPQHNLGHAPNLPPPHMGQPPNLGPPNMGQHPNMGPPPHLNHPPNMGQPHNMGPPPNIGPPAPPPNMGPPPHNFGPPHVPAPNQQPQQGNNIIHPPGNWSDDEPLPQQQQLHQQQQQPELQPLMSMKVDKPDDIKSKNTELVLPKALEDVFAFKDQLADELGRTDGEIPVETEKSIQKTSTGVISTDYADADADSDDDEPQHLAPTVTKQLHRLDKNKKKKLRKKQNRQMRQAKQAELEEKQHSAPVDKSAKENGDVVDGLKNGNADDDVTVEYVPDKITVAELAPMYRQFYRVFELFKLEDKPVTKEPTEIIDDKAAQQKKDKDKMVDDDDDDMDEDKPDDKEKLSKRKLKKLTRLSVAELKQLVNRPDVVEMHDVTARDPKLLVQLKAHRNTVQVPRHWCFKRKYLQGKRGIEKPPFDLPAFIKKTGIMEMRASLQEKDEAKTLKAKMRERARPKMGKIDIDYQKLHDAFFKYVLFTETMNFRH